MKCLKICNCSLLCRLFSFFEMSPSSKWRCVYGRRQKLICIFWLVILRPQANKTDAKDDIIKKADIELHWKCQQMQSGMQCCCILGQINDALGCSFNSMYCVWKSLLFDRYFQIAIRTGSEIESQVSENCTPIVAPWTSSTKLYT